MLDPEGGLNGTEAFWIWTVGWVGRQSDGFGRLVEVA